jgi:hypothetical protein
MYHPQKEILSPIITQRLERYEGIRSIAALFIAFICLAKNIKI